MRTRIVPVIMLVVLAPFTAEFLLGDQYLSGLESAPAQITSFVLFAGFYGTAAALIRELARRLRIGWTGILLLALGFGIFEEGLVTQSLFNPHYLGLSLIEPGYVPGLGIGAPWTAFVLSLHVIWSITTPIAISEAWYGRRDRTGQQTASWLGPIGIVVSLVIFAAAALATAGFNLLLDPHRFVAPGWRLAGALVAVGLAVLAAIRLRGRASAPAPATLRATLLSALLAVLATSALEVSYNASERLPWLRFAGILLVWAIAVVIMVGRHRRGAGPVPFGLAAGAVLTYCWVGLVQAVHAGPGGLVEQGVLVLIALAVVAWTAARSIRSGVPAARPERSPVLS